MLRRLCAAFMAGWLVMPTIAIAYPTRTIRIVNPYPAGGAADSVARLLAEALSTRLGQSVIVENVAGAGGTIGTSQVIRAEPDGHTLLFVNTGNVSINPHLYRRLDHDPRTQLRPIAKLGITDLAVVASNASGFRTLPDALARLQGEPGKVSCAVPGIGTINHLALATFAATTGSRCLEVPYRGAALAVNDIVGGHVQLFFATIPSIAGQVEGGQLRALAVAASRRSALLPSVPTLAEQGVNGADASLWFGLAASANVPQAVVGRLEGAVRDSFTDDFRGRLTAIGVQPDFQPAAEFARFLEADAEHWRRAVEQAGVRLDP